MGSQGYHKVGAASLSQGANHMSNDGSFAKSVQHKGNRLSEWQFLLCANVTRTLNHVMLLQCPIFYGNFYGNLVDHVTTNHLVG